MSEPSERLVTVARYNFTYQAHLAHGMLEDAGIPSVVIGEDRTGLPMFFDPKVGGVRLQVPEAYEDEARELLEGFDVE